jgi:hypothetical protein
MFSVHDKQVGGYLYSGRNSKTIEDCVEAGLSFLTGDWYDREINEVNTMSLRDRKDFLNHFELFPIEHEERLSDD